MKEVMAYQEKKKEIIFTGATNNLQMNNITSNFDEARIYTSVSGRL